MGIELLQEASNVAALQQMYRTMGLNWPAMGGGVPPPPPPSVSPFSSLDLYYRQAAAAHSLQRPFPYKMLPSGAGGTPLPPTHPSPILPLQPNLSCSQYISLHSCILPPNFLNYKYKTSSCILTQNDNKDRQTKILASIYSNNNFYSLHECYTKCI